MSKIEDLIKQYCPNGCEWKRLGDTSLFRISRGVVISKSYIAEHHGQYPVYSSQTENDGCLGCIDTYAIDGERITWTTDGAKAGTVFYRSGKYNITNVCGMIECVSSDISCKYVSYVFGVEAPKFVNKAMGNCKLMSNVVENILIPVPHIAVQDEIVRILDKFTELEKELEKELELRRKQYEFYRDELLTFGDDVERERLGDVTNVCRGKRVVKRELSNSVGHPVYQNSLSILGYYMDSNYPANTSFVIGAGAAGEIGYSLTDFWAADDCFPIICKGMLLDRFVFYFLMQNQAVLKSKVRKASIPRLSRDEIENLIIPIPSPTEQERIVKILDKFDTLTTSLTSGLPAEIKLRKQQYEYYRDYLFGLLN